MEEGKIGGDGGKNEQREREQWEGHEGMEGQWEGNRLKRKNRRQKLWKTIKEGGKWNTGGRIEREEQWEENKLRGKNG